MIYETRNTGIKKNLHPAMQIKILQLEERLNLIREDILYTQGRRSAEYQDSLWQIGRDKNGTIIGETVTNAKGGWSFHNFGAAIDFAPVAFLFPLSDRGRLSWYSIPRFMEVGLQADKIGFEWGGDWKIRDYGHIQYTQGMTIQDFRAGKELDFSFAKQEYIDDLSDQLAKIEHALNRKNGTWMRKKRLTTAYERLSRKLERVDELV